MGEKQEARTFVLYVGQPTYVAGFDSQNWEVLVQWIAELGCECVVYFSAVAREAMESLLREWGGSWSPEDFPDPDAAIRGFRVSGRRPSLHGLLGGLPLDPERGVTHLLCSSGQRLIVSLEVDDGLNFVVLNLWSDEARELVERIPDVDGNVAMCERAREYIERVVGVGDRWFPLGKR